MPVTTTTNEEHIVFIERIAQAIILNACLGLNIIIYDTLTPFLSRSPYIFVPSAKLEQIGV